MIPASPITPQTAITVTAVRSLLTAMALRACASLRLRDLILFFASMTTTALSACIYRETFVLVYD
jgi:hypothetical protein